MIDLERSSPEAPLFFFLQGWWFQIVLVWDLDVFVLSQRQHLKCISHACQNKCAEVTVMPLSPFFQRSSNHTWAMASGKCILSVKSVTKRCRASLTWVAISRSSTVPLSAPTPASSAWQSSGGGVIWRCTTPSATQTRCTRPNPSTTRSRDAKRTSPEVLRTLEISRRLLSCRKC